jgi:hypothetical protein
LIFGVADRPNAPGVPRRDGKQGDDQSHKHDGGHLQRAHDCFAPLLSATIAALTASTGDATGLEVVS